MSPRQPLDIVTLDIMIRRLGGGGSSCPYLEVETTTRREESRTSDQAAQGFCRSTIDENRRASNEETNRSQRMYKGTVAVSKSCGNTRTQSPSSRKSTETAKTNRLHGVRIAFDSRKPSQ